MGTLVPNPVSLPYPTINSVMDRARAACNEMQDSVNGTLLTNDAPYSQVYLSEAWTWLQNQLARVGGPNLEREMYLFGLPVRASQDVASPAWVTWSGCSDGVNQFEQPRLNYDLIQPKFIWRRASGTMTFPERPMQVAKNGSLPGWLDPDTYLWREDGLYFYGAQVPQDFKILYSAYWQDLDITQPQFQIPIRGCENALGCYVAYLFASPRGGAGSGELLNRAQQAFQDGLGSQTSKLKQLQTIHRRSRDEDYGGWQRPYIINS